MYGRRRLARRSSPNPPEPTGNCSASKERQRDGRETPVSRWPCTESHSARVRRGIIELDAHIRCIVHALPRILSQATSEQYTNPWRRFVRETLPVRLSPKNGSNGV